MIALAAALALACGAARGETSAAPPSAGARSDASEDTSQHRALVREISRGVWGWPEGASSCEENPHVIEVSEDLRVMRITRRRPYSDEDPRREAIYDIVFIGEGFLRGRIRGEERRTPAGKLVVWDLVLLGEGAYCWHRTDWSAGGCTETIRRCPGMEELPPPD